MYPGYALGCIIEEPDYMVPFLKKQMMAFADEIKKAEFDKQTMLESEDFKALEKEAKQNQLNPKNQEIGLKKRRFEDIAKRLQEFCQREVDFSLQEHLPIDFTQTMVVDYNHAFESERSYHLFVDDDNTPRHQVDRFISQLFLQGSPASALPPGVVDSLVEDALSMRKTGVKISFVGSVITLQRVRTFDRIAIRGEAISQKLRDNCHKYYVLTQVVLGAVFVGLGKHITGSGDPKGGPLTESKMTDMHVTSFYSQGVIPEANESVEDINMYQVYSRWKKSLMENKSSGFPIAVYFRKLTDLFDEQGIPHSQTPSGSGQTQAITKVPIK